ncbi:MAG: hypothetical protein IKG18_12205 [Atopobiaceae bacterium]|nr:hypothetical protein [Atopobiaceae bacterium]
MPVRSDAQRSTGICSSSERKLLNDEVLTRLRRDDLISSLVEAMRRNEDFVAEKARKLGDARVHLACRQEIVSPLED